MIIGVWIGLVVELSGDDVGEWSVHCCCCATAGGFVYSALGAGQYFSQA